MIQNVFETLNSAQALLEFARGGGGGSGGGGGGGGGSGGGSGSGPGGLLFLIGYLPTYYSCVLCNKFDMPKAAGYAAGAAVGFIVTVAVGLLSVGLAILVLLGAIVGTYSGMNDLHSRVKKRMKVSKKEMQVAASKDPAWQEASILPRVGQVFLAYQQDWTSFNVQRMQTYMTPEYYAHVYLMMKALGQMQRQNVVGDPQLMQSMISDIQDHDDNTHDTFTAYIMARANDQLIDKVSGSVLYTDKSAFQEFWTFNRQGNDWVLASIRQATESFFMRDAKLEAFAKQNNMFYSPDWGWLLLPKRGQLFGKANFKNSDVNNHVIGEWEGLLVQMYTYVPNKNADSQANYLIGQINLPKSYGGIIIKRRSKWDVFSFKPRGYQKVSFEWPDFNQRYNVYATDLDKVTSFELLNPKFMAQLYDENIKVNIEVVDNVVYFSTAARSTNTNYPSMLQILVRAYHELKR